MSGLMTAASSKAPTVDKSGELILDQATLAKSWRDFLAGKFKATDAEAERLASRYVEKMILHTFTVTPFAKCRFVFRV